MSPDFLLFTYAGNPVVWAIIALALFCYVLQFNMLLSPVDAAWRQRSSIWLKVLPVLLGVLPLLGLFGTIAGLLDTFQALARVGSLDQQALLSSGIADALITTQLGLLTVIPGLLLQARLRYRYRKQEPA